MKKKLKKKYKGAAGSLYDEPFNFGEQPLAASNNSKQLEVETKQPRSNN